MTQPGPRQPYPEERRLVTVMCADLLGLPDLSETLDIESISDLIKEVWLSLDQVIIDLDGHIDTHLGDGITAVWGAPYSGEDDAKRAVTAGLDLLNTLKAYQGNSIRHGAHNLGLRIGIHTGAVLATYVGVNPKYTIFGETVHIARQLAEMTQAGQVLVSDICFRLVRGLFRVRSRDTLKLAGHNPPAEGYFIDAKRQQPTRVRYQDEGGLETRMVGRAAELEALHENYKLLRSSSSPSLTLLIGEVGIGKSRLLHEFTNELEISDGDLNLLTVRGFAEAEKVPYFLWKSLWKHRFGLSEDLDPDKGRTRFLRGMRDLWGNRLGQYSAIEAAHLVGDLIGLDWSDSPFLAKFEDNPLGRTYRAFELTKEVLLRIADSGPLVLIIDDLHWFDLGSLDLLVYLLQPGPIPLPLLIIGGARPELFKKQMRWANNGDIITLNPVEFDVERVREAYPAVAPYSDSVLQALVEKADGNPYFLEELVKSLFTPRGEIITESLNIKTEELPDQFPNTLKTLVQARLDSLTREAREVALIASVIGRVFWAGGVVSAAKQPIGTGMLNLPEEILERVVQTALRELIRAELAFPRRGGIFAGEQEFIFKHTLLRDIAYSLIPRKNLKFYHYSVANWLADRAGADFNVMIAEHFEKAGKIPTAIRYYQDAVKYAYTRGAESELTWLNTRLVELRNIILPVSKIEGTDYAAKN